MRRAVLLCLLLVAGGAATAGAARAAGPPEPVDLSGPHWEFRVDPLDVGRFSGWAANSSPNGWKPKPVPSVFDSDPVPEEFGGTVAWYRRTFTPPDLPAGFAWAIRFEQVRRSARVWLNGRPLGSNDNPYLPFTVLGEGMRPGAFNTLTVRVDNRKPGVVREGWWNWGGITRPVSLVPVGPAHLENLGLLPQLQCGSGGRCRASVLVDGQVRNRTAAPLAPVVGVSLRSPSGTVSQRTVVLRPVGPGAVAPVRFSVPVSGTPQLWSPSNPSLYGAWVQTSVQGAPVQLDRLRIGLRSIKVSDGLLYLNGRPLQLRGASIQEDLPGRGPALDAAGMDSIVGDLKHLGANATRAQYLLNDRLLSKLDAAGIMVWSQAANYHDDVQLRTAAGRDEALRVVRATILAARNHPSVFTHSVANELSPTPDAVPPTRTFLQQAAGLARRLDPTLPPSLDILSYPGFPRQHTYDLFPLLGINSYFGWYKGKAGHYVGSFSGLRPYLDSIRAHYPRQAVMMTEFGAEASQHGPVARKQTYEFQARYLRRTLDVVKANPWLAGAIYWTAREFAVKPFWDGGADIPFLQRDSIHKKGLISYDGTPKPAAALARQIFTETPPFAPPEAARKARAATRKALRRFVRGRGR
jgi:beta-galactosidase/beta-glucuronidase